MRSLNSRQSSRSRAVARGAAFARAGSAEVTESHPSAGSGLAAPHATGLAEQTAAFRQVLSADATSVTASAILEEVAHLPKKEGLPQPCVARLQFSDTSSSIRHTRSAEEASIDLVSMKRSRPIPLSLMTCGACLASFSLPSTRKERREKLYPSM
jgi:hypothetical protein